MRVLFNSPLGIRLRTTLGLLLILFALIGSPLLLNVTVDNSLARWVENDTSTPEFENSFEELVTVLIQVSGEDLLSDNSLAILVSALEKLESIPNVVRVEGIPTLYRDLYGLSDREALEEEMRTSSYFQKLYISPDMKHLSLIVMLTPDEIGQSDRVIYDRIIEVTQGLEGNGFSTTMVGPVVMNAELDRLSIQESTRLFPLAFVVSSLMLFILLGSWRAALVAIASAGLSLIVLLITISSTHYSFNMITVSVPPLIWVLSLSASIHMIHRYMAQRLKGEEAHSAAQSALDDTAYPNTFASLTTALGFLSLRVSDMAPVQELGFLVAVGMLLTIAVNLSITPLLLALFKPVGVENNVAQRIRFSDTIYPRITLLIVIIAGVAIIPGIQKIRTESNPLSMFSSDSHVLKQYDALSKELAGPATLETIIQLPSPWYDHETWPSIEKITQVLNSRNIAVKTIGPLEGLQLIHQWDSGEGVEGYRLPDSAERTEQLVGMIKEFELNQFEQMIHPSGNTIRIITFVNEMNSSRYLEYVAEVDYALGTMPKGYKGYTTGTVLRIVRAQNNLVTQQFQSFGLAFGVIFMCMLIGLRSIRMLLLSIVPNILPIATVFGLMGYFDISLNTGSVMVASVVLGIGVDDTVHMLVALARNQSEGPISSNVVQKTVDSISPALVTTTTVIGCGFLVLTLSNFVPLIHFGFLASIAIFVALWADLRLVPAILLSRNNKPS